MDQQLWLAARHFLFNTENGEGVGGRLLTPNHEQNYQILICAIGTTKEEGQHKEEEYDRHCAAMFHNFYSLHV